MKIERIDSNALIATAKKVLGYDVHGFTIVNSDARYEEQDMVQASVQALAWTDPCRRAIRALAVSTVTAASRQ